ncbi:hypothetical protein D3C76_1770600 [compost metagenome]
MQAYAWLDDVDEYKANQHRDGADDFEVKQGLHAKPTQLAHVLNVGKPMHQCHKDNRRKHHFQKGNKGLA